MRGAGRHFDVTPLHQLSFRAYLEIMTGTQIALALVCWDRDFGYLLAIPFVGGWWLVELIRARRYRIAYGLAAWVMGALWYLALSFRVSPASYEFLHVWRVWPEAVDVMAMCLATAAASMLLERWIGRPAGGHPILVGVGLTYVAMALYPLAWVAAATFFTPLFGRPTTSPGAVALGGSTLAGLGVEAIWAVPSTVVMATRSLHVAAPMGIATACLLRWILLSAADLPQREDETLHVVDELQAAGRDPIRGYHVAERLGCNPQTALGRLEQLWRFHRITWTARHGYRRVR